MKLSTSHLRQAILATMSAAAFGLFICQPTMSFADTPTTGTIAVIAETPTTTSSTSTETSAVSTTPANNTAASSYADTMKILEALRANTDATANAYAQAAAVEPPAYVLEGIYNLPPSDYDANQVTPYGALAYQAKAYEAEYNPQPPVEAAQIEPANSKPTIVPDQSTSNFGSTTIPKAPTGVTEPANLLQANAATTSTSTSTTATSQQNVSDAVTTTATPVASSQALTTPVTLVNPTINTSSWQRTSFSVGAQTFSMKMLPNNSSFSVQNSNEQIGRSNRSQVTLYMNGVVQGENYTAAVTFTAPPTNPTQFQLTSDANIQKLVPNSFNTTINNASTGNTSYTYTKFGNQWIGGKSGSITTGNTSGVYTQAVTVINNFDVTTTVAATATQASEARNIAYALIESIQKAK